VLSHRNVLFASLNQILGWRLSAADRGLVVAPFHHVGGLLVLGFPCLHTGGTVHLASPEPAAVLEAVERERSTAIFLPPRLWRRLAEFEGLEAAGLASVRLCASGGDHIRTETLKRLADAFGAEFTDAYGLTEASSVSTLLPGAEVFRKAGSAGVACTHNRLRVLTPDGTEAAPGETGELVLAGPTVMLGYRARPEETEHALRNGWLRTGDLGLLDEEGYLYVSGRSKDLIVSAGKKVYSAEVERVLREHPAVADAAVIGIPDQELGETVVAVVTARPGVTLTPAEVIAFCRGKLADYKHPTAAYLSESLPLTSNGKVQKAELRARYGAVR
jgi:fatty-acyl-CoA synthase